MARRLPVVADEALTPTQLYYRNRSRRSRAVPAKTVSIRRMSLRELERDRALYPDDGDEWRPVVRADCRDVPRPCPFVSCKWHLYLDVDERIGSLKFNFPDLEPDELAETCALDVAERGPVTLERAADLLNITRERLRQIEQKALSKVAEDDEAVAIAIGALGE